jgi:hypothetical protein
VLAQQPNYRKSGFELAWRNMRHEGRGGASAPADARIAISPACPSPPVCAYDRAYFPAERTAFCGLVAQPDAAGRAGSRTAAAGLWAGPRCRSGWKIGPLFAEGEAIAEGLYLALCSRVGADEAVCLDLPSRTRRRWHWRSATACGWCSRPRACTPAGRHP